MKRIGKAFCALFLALLVVVPTCLAANHSHSYTVAGTGGVWNGKEEGVLWVLNKDEAVFTASITSSETRTIGAQLRYIREYFPDSTVCYREERYIKLLATVLSKRYVCRPLCVCHLFGRKRRSGKRYRKPIMVFMLWRPIGAP